MIFGRDIDISAYRAEGVFEVEVSAAAGQADGFRVQRFRVEERKDPQLVV